MSRDHHNITIDAGKELVLDDIRGDSLELAIDLQPEGTHEFGIKVRRSPDGAEETAIIFDPKSGTLKIDVSKSTLDPAIRYRSWSLFQPPDAIDATRRVLTQEAPLTMQPGEPLRLRIFLDHSMLEVFANNRQCLTQRLWPTRNDATGVSLFSNGSKTTVRSLEAWEMAASSAE